MSPSECAIDTGLTSWLILLCSCLRVYLHYKLFFLLQLVIPIHPSVSQFDFASLKFVQSLHLSLHLEL